LFQTAINRPRTDFLTIFIKQWKLAASLSETFLEPFDLSAGWFASMSIFNLRLYVHSLPSVER